MLLRQRGAALFNPHLSNSKKIQAKKNRRFKAPVFYGKFNWPQPNYQARFKNFFSMRALSVAAYRADQQNVLPTLHGL